MNTYFALMACHQKPLIPLETVGDEYLGLGKREVNTQALRNKLPFPVIQLTDSRTAPRFVRIEDLASWIDEQSEKAKTVWKRNQV